MYIAHGQLVQNPAKEELKWDNVKSKFQLNLEEMLAKEGRQNKEYVMSKDAQVSFQTKQVFCSSNMKIIMKV